MASLREEAQNNGREMAELFLPFLRTDVPDGNLYRLAIKLAKWDAMPQMSGNVDLALEYAQSFVNVFQEYRAANQALMIAGQGAKNATNILAGKETQ